MNIHKKGEKVLSTYPPSQKCEVTQDDKQIAAKLTSKLQKVVNKRTASLICNNEKQLLKIANLLSIRIPAFALLL